MCHKTFKPQEKIYWREYFDKNGVRKEFMHYECYRDHYEKEEKLI